MTKPGEREMLTPGKSGARPEARRHCTLFYKENK